MFVVTSLQITCQLTNIKLPQEKRGSRVLQGDWDVKGIEVVLVEEGGKDRGDNEVRWV